MSKDKCKTCKGTKWLYQGKPFPAEPNPNNYVNLLRAERAIKCPDCK